MDYNRVILIGRLASDPELKYTPSGIAVTQFRMAVNRPMSAEARQSGQEKQADFFSIVAWRQSAEYVANYLGKGRLVMVEGRLQVREYEHNGQKRRDTEIVVDNLKSLDRPKEAGEGGGNGGGGYGRGGGQHDDFHDESAPAREPAPAREAPAARAAAPAPAPSRRPGNSAPSGGSRYQAPPPEDDMDDPFADS
ncbi:MAG: single-stranded DNA-binding protein [Armatimonadetes bacterium]|nr:single-stranded DNA-binding protein [Armatimonadota bacterium]